MARHPNGRIPKGLLVHLGGDHWLTPGTKVRWERLVADVLKNEGVRLQITGGPNAYRDIEWQRHYWNTLPYPQAAYPGTSSHGGEYNGRDSMAIDVNNWGMIGKDKFYAYARKHGFEPNFFDWEPWHIIDWSPWSVPPAPTPTPIDESEEDDMKLLYVTDSVDGNDIPGWALLNARTGKVLPLRTDVAGAQDNANSWARVWGDAKTVTRQDMLNAIAAIQKTS